MERKRKRMHSVEKEIKDLGRDDFRVSILGTIMEMNRGEYEAVLDDGTGRAAVQFSDPEQFQNLKEGEAVRVIGRVIPGDERIIEAEIIQDMSKLDMNLFKQVKYIEEKLKER